MSEAEGSVRHEWPLADSLSLSCQRHPLPDSGVVQGIPRSWGALPLLVAGPRHLLVPVPDGEGLWLGLVREPGAPTWPVRVLALPGGGGPVVDVLTGHPEDRGGEGVLVPPAHAVVGMARGDGTFWPFTRAARRTGGLSCAALDVLTGLPNPPIDPPGATTGRPPRHDRPGSAERSVPARQPAPPAAARRGRAWGDSPLRLEFVTPAVFRAAGGGLLPPLDQHAPYRGRRLP